MMKPSLVFLSLTLMGALFTCYVSVPPPHSQRLARQPEAKDQLKLAMPR